MCRSIGRERRRKERWSEGIVRGKRVNRVGKRR